MNVLLYLRRLDLNGGASILMHSPCPALQNWLQPLYEIAKAAANADHARHDSGTLGSVFLIPWHFLTG